jgi:hypothetical protein
VCSFGKHTVTLKEIARCSLKVEPLAERMRDAVTGNRKISLLLKKDRKTAYLQGAKGSDAENRPKQKSFGTLLVSAQTKRVLEPKSERGSATTPHFLG